ncbi:hypothetical protein HPB47_003193 [Ixodes persulcatus]|uniref:Uncharacterized protein n=1 Tax=Ixodes persulcatus TaxID=34615 RepID=A0AC60PJ51_IXOPE|nr:hypothetical protein HPB47_003193 [Ixodes persulcatus]
MQQGEPSDPPPVTVAAAAVRLPPYWDRNPRVWFLQAESQFHLAGVATQGRKYHHIVSALSPAAADKVYDVLANTSPATPYDQLKNALLQRTELFLQRLPFNVQMVLATATTLDLTGLAALADAVMEVTTPSQPTTRDSGSAANSQPPQANVEQLCQRLEEIVVAATQGRAPHPLERHRRQGAPEKQVNHSREVPREEAAPAGLRHEEAGVPQAPQSALPEAAPQKEGP